MCRRQHEHVNEQLYASGEGVERLDTPLVMKLDENHFPVTGDERVPRDTLAVPEGLLTETRIRNPPTLEEVLLAKADRARQLLELTGGSVGTAEEGGDDEEDGFVFDGGSDGPAI
jgi:hypothetical protein